MALYTRKHGEYTKLSKDDARRYRRVDEVIALQKLATGSANTMRALAAWMEAIGTKGGRMNEGDLCVTKLPNIARLRHQADALTEKARALKWV